ncbi:MAG: prolyl oligopeptidase family serine peptidase [Clostridia bacterium]|nr:prolyl oligopeptidase family serine peptidase [Clostridia bacterium]
MEEQKLGMYKTGSQAELVLQVNALESEHPIDAEETQLPSSFYEKILRYMDGKDEHGVTCFRKQGTYGPIIPNSPKAQLLFFAVESKRDTQLVMFTYNERRHKFWLNGEFIGVDFARSLYTLSLRAGKNCFVFEYLPNEGDSEFQVRLNLLENEMKNEYTSYVRNNFYTQYNRAVLWEYEYHWNKPDPFRFMLTAQDHLHVDIGQICKIEVLEYDDKTPIYADSVSFYQPYRVDMSRFAGNKRLLRLKIYYYDTAGVMYTITRVFFFGDVDAASDTLQGKYHEALEDASYSEEEHLFLRQELTRYSARRAQNRLTGMDVFMLADTYATVVSKRYIKRLSSPGWVPIYYYSKMDQKLHNYAVCLPLDFDLQTSYPLLLRYETLNNAPTTPMYAIGLRGMIVVDVPLRGITLGSYCGDASFREVLLDVKRRYRIDESRIYAAGYSNGAYATWSLAQAYPSVFAAILPYAGGMDTQKIKNLYNLPILRVESEGDHRYRREGNRYTSGLKRCKSYRLVRADACTHPSLEFITLNSQMLHLLQTFKKENYPDKIRYRTDKNRHLEAYWIKLHSIAPSKAYAEVKASVEDGNIRISVQNVTGITVKIPPQANRDRGFVFINRKPITPLSEIRESYAHFVRTPRGFVRTEEAAPCKIYHGAGLLDIFMDRMQIINCDIDPTMQRVASMFSHPQMNTYKHTLDVAYPILSLEDVDPAMMQESDLVIVDANRDAPLLRQLREGCPIPMDAEGFHYAGSSYRGKYCIMQIFQNPICPHHNILYINANDPALYAKNLFTRTLIIPTYTNGRHPFLNNEALIFFNGKYYTVFDAVAKDSMRPLNG